MDAQKPLWSRLLDDGDAFSREDESDDAVFYARERMVQHLDAVALATLEELVEHLVVEEQPAILDLMASFDSHLPSTLTPSRVTGLGLNAAELRANSALTESVLHDLNRDHVLPFDDDSFDVVLNVVSIAYLTRPVEVIAEVARVLRPGGLLLVVFSNRSFPAKEVRLWELLGEDERVELVKDHVCTAGGFGEPRTWMTMGAPRPPDDRYADRGVPSDPLYAVWAETPGARPDRPERRLPDARRTSAPPELVRERLAAVPATGRCPHCEERLRTWAVSENPMGTWDHDLLVCANDACPYVVAGWEVMFRQGMPGHTTRFVYDPKSETRISIAVPSLSVIKGELR